MKTLPIILGLWLLLTPALHAGAETNNPGDDPAAVQKQLDALEAEIQKFREMLEATRGERSKLEENLETNEKEISDLLKKIEQIEKDLKSVENKVSALTEQRVDLEHARSEQQALIARQIKAAYKMGRQEFLKVVLNQEDPDEMSRMLTYYDYFNRARTDQVERYKRTISELTRVTTALEVQNRELETNRLTLANEQRSLERARTEKQATLSSLNQEIARTGSLLDVREKDRERLEALLERITAGIINLPTPQDTVPFANRRGDLVLPVVGQVTNRFGSTRSEGKLRWNGVFIEARQGEPVTAVHYGRVVFSDWLRGFGLLLIINHGDGYMSLYGHNQVLYRETGDWVIAGETIATVGDSGGQNRAGLYFEIRHAGKPTDPQLWCKAATAKAA